MNSLRFGMLSRIVSLKLFIYALEKRDLLHATGLTTLRSIHQSICWHRARIKAACYATEITESSNALFVPRIARALARLLIRIASSLFAFLTTGPNFIYWHHRSSRHSAFDYFQIQDRSFLSAFALATCLLCYSLPTQLSRSANQIYQKNQDK